VYVIIWEFRVKAEMIHKFISAYKPDGEWAQLFRLAEGYIGTELLFSSDDEERFITIDRWSSPTDFIRFQDRLGEQYQSLDAHLDGLTAEEVNLGSFVTTTDAPPSK
jgi:heme-degrading monooxygenase HmoA